MITIRLLEWNEHDKGMRKILPRYKSEKRG